MSAQVGKLMEGVKAGRWLLPTSDGPNPVSLARAIAGICGAPSDGKLDPVADRLRGLIGEPEHLVFVIADGFGMNFVNTLAEDSFSRSNLALESRAVFPPITGANLFAMAQGLWPGQHAVTGWFVHLAELGERATLFPWIRTRDGKNLSELGLTGKIVYPGDALVSSFEKDSICLIPEELVSSIPTGALHGTFARGHSGLADAVDQVVVRVQSTGSSYTEIYWPNVDKAAHSFGSESTETLEAVKTLEAELDRLRSELPDSARIVVTGDHGHSDIPDDLKFVVGLDDVLQPLLITAPSGDNRTQNFRVRAGMHARFAELFIERFGEHFFLFSSEDVASLGLLGPDGISDLTMDRLGDFMAVAKGRAVMKFLTPENQRPIREKSEHGGFSPAEMLVPLIIA